MQPDDYFDAVEARQERALRPLFPRAVTAPQPPQEEEKTVNGPWTDEEDLILRENAHLGKGGAATMVGRTPSAVKYRAWTLGISLKKRDVGESIPTPEPPAKSDHKAVEDGCDAFAVAAQEEHDAELTNVSTCRVCGCTDPQQYEHVGVDMASCGDFAQGQVLEACHDFRLELIATYARLAQVLFNHGGVCESVEADEALDRIGELAS